MPTLSIMAENATLSIMAENTTLSIMAENATQKTLIIMSHSVSHFKNYVECRYAECE
jgi:hypothetical protein